MVHVSGGSVHIHKVHVVQILWRGNAQCIHTAQGSFVWQMTAIKYMYINITCTYSTILFLKIKIMTFSACMCIIHCFLLKFEIAGMLSTEQYTHNVRVLVKIVKRVSFNDISSQVVYSHWQ